MDIDFDPEDEAFRDEVRAFIAEHYRPEMRARSAKSTTGYLEKDDHVRWQKALYEKGWIAPNWPVEYGGAGWPQAKKYIFETEVMRAGAPRVVSFGLKMVAPVIMHYGTEAQKRRFLPDILASNVWWCQGYSEPGAGSDLASLSTRAVRDGDDYVINGAKIWTTRAQDADWIFCLVRTSSEGKRQAGISFLLIDMTTPGIEVRPLITLDRTMAGLQEVNEVRFTDVRVPRANRVGEENQGWTVAKYLLEFERGNASAGGLHGALARVRQMAEHEPDGEAPLLENESFRRRLDALEIETRAVEVTELRILSSLSSGERPGPESSILKTRGTEVSQAISELAVEAIAYYGVPFDRDVLAFGANTAPIGPDYSTNTAGRYFNLRKASIYGGSNEIQRNIMAKLVLGL